MNKSLIFPDDPYPLSADPVYFDGKPIRPKLGRHGRGAKVGSGDVIMPIDVSGLQEGQAVVPLQPTDPTHMVSRMHSEESSSNLIDDRSMVEFICWGKSHRYFTEDYYRFAPRYLDALKSECRITARHMQGDYALAIEYLEPDGTLGGWLTSCVKDFRDKFRDHKPFKPEEFFPLENELWSYHRALCNASADDYKLIHSTGIKLMKVRYRRDYLNKKLRDSIESLIDDAEFGKQGAEQVEDVAFSVLDLYAQVVGATSPARKAAYQCAFVFIRAGAHSLGETTAGNSNRRALLALGDVLRKQLPGVFSDMLMGYVKKGMPSQEKTPLPGEVFVTEFLKIQIWMVFFTIDFWIFEVERLRGKDKQNQSDVYIKRLAVDGAKQLVGSVAAITGSTLRVTERSKLYELWLGRLEAAIPAVVLAVYEEVTKLQDMAQKEKRPFYEVLTAEIGWCMVRVVKACAMALAKAPMEKKMKEMHVRDALYYELLLGDIDLSRRSALEPNSKAAIVMMVGDPVPAAKPKGPDADGSIGMARYDTAPGPAAPTDLAPATPPKRADRKKVKLVEVDEDVGKPYIPTATSKGDGASGRASREAIDQRILLAHQNILSGKPEPLQHLLEGHGRLDMLSDFASVDPGMSKTERLSQLKQALRITDDGESKHWIQWHHTVQTSSDTTMAGEVETIQPVSKVEHRDDEHRNDYGATPTAGIRGDVTSSASPIYDPNDYEQRQSSMSQDVRSYDDDIYACSPEDSWNAALDEGVSLAEYYQDD